MGANHHHHHHHHAGRPPARDPDAPPAGVPKAARIDRRRFLGTSLAAVGAYAVAASGATWLVGPGKAWAVEFESLAPDLAATLVAMTRALYPHEFLGDIYYAAVVKDLEAEASGFDDKDRMQTLRDGMLALNQAAGGTFTSATPEDRQKALAAISDTPFFQAVRGKTVVSLYSQQEVWAKFGYEGPSYEKGGYIENGFNDLSWLPDPPAEASPPVRI